MTALSSLEKESFGQKKVLLNFPKALTLNFCWKVNSEAWGLGLESSSIWSGDVLKSLLIAPKSRHRELIANSIARVKES